MKKAIIITTMFVAVLALGIAESVWGYRHFGTICEKLERACERLETAEEGVTDEEALTALREAGEEGRAPLLALVSNPNITEKVTEYAAQALVYAAEGQNADARSAALAAKRAAERLQKECFPSVFNIL